MIVCGVCWPIDNLSEAYWRPLRGRNLFFFLQTWKLRIVCRSGQVSNRVGRWNPTLKDFSGLFLVIIMGSSSSTGSGGGAGECWRSLLWAHYAGQRERERATYSAALLVSKFISLYMYIHGRVSYFTSQLLEKPAVLYGYMVVGLFGTHTKSHMKCLTYAPNFGFSTQK